LRSREKKGALDGKAGDSIRAGNRSPNQFVERRNAATRALEGNWVLQGSQSSLENRRKEDEEGRKEEGGILVTTSYHFDFWKLPTTPNTESRQRIILRQLLPEGRRKKKADDGEDEEEKEELCIVCFVACVSCFLLLL
jgi:hypothetical protein